MARRAFIGANRRTDGIRRKPGRAEIAKGGGRGGRRPVVSLAPPAGPDRLDPIRVDIIPGGAGGASSNPLDDFGNPKNAGDAPLIKAEAIPQTISGFPVDIKTNRPGQGDTKGDEIISDVDLKEKKKRKDLILPPPPPPPKGPFIKDLPDFKEVKTGLGVLGSGDVRQQEILGGPIKIKKKKKIIRIKRKPIKVDVRKVKSKRGNARNNIKAGLKKERVPNGETIIEVINEQIEVTRKTKKVSRPAPVRSVIQIVRPRPSVPVREVRPTRSIGGQPIRVVAPPALGVPSPPPVRQAVETRPRVATAPIRTSRPQVASAPVRTRRTRRTRRQGGGRY